MKNLQFAIPSYKRSHRISQETLGTLSNLGVPDDMITIFVADSEEEKLYQEATDNHYTIVVGELGIGNQRIVINNYYPEGTRIVSLDDDVEIIRKEENKTVPLDEPLIPLVTRAFDLCDKEGVKFWGTPNTFNGFYMNHSTVNGLRGCCGSMFGEYAKTSETQSSMDHSEDLEKTLLHYRTYGGFLRVNDFTAKQKRNAEGGVLAQCGGLEQRYETHRRTIEQILKRYPDLVSLKKNPDPEKGMVRVKVKTNTRHPSLLLNAPKG